MRIAIVNHHRQLVGGTESYLKRIIPELTRLGHAVSFWHEAAVSPNSAAIDAPEVFLADAAKLRAWRPQLIYNNGLMGMPWESSLPGIAPVVHYAHNYYGTCISGEKTRKFPTPSACSRCLGPGCVANYLPRRCGGLNPLTMWHDYRLQSHRLRNLRAAFAIVTASRHIESEYRRHGFSQVHRAPLFVDPPRPQACSERRRLLFCGRMMRLKGGALLLDAIPLVEKLIGQPIEVFFAGEGPERAVWQARGAEAQFTGWISQEALRGLNAGLLVMPSLWPEPFGLAGLELGLPVAAFPSGGIPDWLRDGVNGHLAATTDAPGLAAAIAACIQDPLHFQHLQAGALAVAAEFTLERHLTALLPIFEAARA